MKTVGLVMIFAALSLAGDKQGDDNNGERQGGVFGNLNAQVHKDADIVCIDSSRQDIRQPS